MDFGWPTQITTFTYDPVGGVTAQRSGMADLIIAPGSNDRRHIDEATHVGTCGVGPKAQTLRIGLTVEDGIVKQANYDIENIVAVAERICGQIRGMTIAQLRLHLAEQTRIPPGEAGRVVASALTAALDAGEAQ